jgi:hypothetical protein
MRSRDRAWVVAGVAVLALPVALATSLSRGATTTTAASDGGAADTLHAPNEQQKPGIVCEKGPLTRGRCFNVRGTVAVWNGWPPFIRIEASGKTYGVGPPEDEVLPSNLRSALFSGGDDRASGEMRLCPLGTSLQPPYLTKPIKLYCVERFKPMASPRR